MGLDSGAATVGASTGGPTTMQLVGAGFQGFGAGSSAAGAFFGADAQKTSLKATAQTAEANARIMELAAQSEIMAGQRREQSERLKTANMKGTQKVAFAANGVDISSDSAVNVLTTTDTFGEISANTEAANAARSAWGYRTEATNQLNKARSARSSAKAINPFSSALTSLINSTSAISKSMYELNKQTGSSAATIKDTSAVQTDSRAEFGPFDDSLPWRNQPMKALY